MVLRACCEYHLIESEFRTLILEYMAQINYKKFGGLVYDWRTRKGLTQEQLAFSAGISVTYISKIENGQTNVSLEAICKLAKGLGITVHELTKGM